MFKKHQAFRPTGLNNNDNKLEQVKQYPIENLYSGNLKKSSKAKMGCCPFHKEENPSFAIYPETNTWYCFVCKEGGDVLSFYMKQNDCDFQTALEALAEK